MRSTLLCAAGALGLIALQPSGARAASDFPACLQSLRSAAAAHGVTPETFDAATNGLEPNDVLHFQDEQPEFTTPVWDYMAGLVDQERVDDALRRIEARFGVDRHILVALWGVESDFGKNFGYRPIVQSLATLSCYGHKPAYYQSELFSALTILQHGDVKPDSFVGSWAGAFGHTQFMPSTFLRTGIDMEGYAGPTGRKNRHPLSFWAAHGLTRVDGEALGSGSEEAGLLLLTGRAGPAFLVTRNFDAIYAYNAAEVYALAIGHLSDRLRGAGPIVTPWPTDDPGLSRVERRELQSLLAGKGYDIAKQDGVIGTQTRQAIASYQQKIGVPIDGRASVSVLKAVREGR